MNANIRLRNRIAVLEREHCCDKCGQPIDPLAKSVRQMSDQELDDELDRMDQELIELTATEELVRQKGLYVARVDAELARRRAVVTVMTY